MGRRVNKRLLHIFARTQNGGGRTTCLDYVQPCVSEFQTRAVLGDDPELAGRLRRAGVEVWQTGIDRSTAGFLAIPKLVRILRSARPDGVVLHGQPGGFLGALAARWCGLRRVVYFAHFPSFYTDWDLFRVLRNRVVERRTCAAAARVICACEANRYQYLLRHLVDEQRVVTIPAGIRTDDIAPLTDRAALRRELQFDDPGIHVVSVGRLADQKRVDWLLRAWQQVERVLPEARLHVVGDGPERASLEALARQLGLVRCRFAGYQPAGHRYLQAADLAVVTSMFESPGLVVLEAMAAGCPVVANAVDGLSESVVPGVTGELAPPAAPGALAEAILRLIKDPQRRRDMSAQGRRLVESRNALPVILERQFAIYREVMGVTDAVV